MVWLCPPARVGFGPSIPPSNRWRRMFWQAIQDFLTGNANLIGAIAALVAIAGALVARGLWMYRRVSGRDKPAPPAEVAAIVERLTEEARRRGAATSQLEGASQREEDLRDQVRQLTAAVEPSLPSAVSRRRHPESTKPSTY